MSDENQIMKQLWSCSATWQRSQCPVAKTSQPVGRIVDRFADLREAERPLPPVPAHDGLYQRSNQQRLDRRFPIRLSLHRTCRCFFSLPTRCDFVVFACTWDFYAADTARPRNFTILYTIQPTSRSQLSQDPVPRETLQLDSLKLDIGMWTNF